MLVGSLAAQVTPFVLRYTVDTVQNMLDRSQGLVRGLKRLGWVGGILPGEEIVSTFITFGQQYYGEKIRVNSSSTLSQKAVGKILSCGFGQCSNEGNQTGKLQTCIDRGVESFMEPV